MKRKILIVILSLIVLSQVAFAYRLYRLRRLRSAINQLATQRVLSTSDADYVDYKGVIHVHSSLGGHSTGNFAELIAAAKANQLDFVIMTEHPQADFDTAAMTLNGSHSGVLFIDGNEVASADGDRLLLIPGATNANTLSRQSTEHIIEEQTTRGGLALAAYPSESQHWQSTNVNGVEIYNLFTNARQANRLALFFDGMWSYGNYADLLFANFFARPDENLKRWDDAIRERGRKLVATAGNDAHSNIGISLNDETGKQLIGIKLDPYERSFRTVRTHVLIKKDKGLTRESLLEALSLGHCYVAFDIFSDATGFRFETDNATKIMGDDTSANGELRLRVNSPLAARIVLFKDGSPVDEKNGANPEFISGGAGVYRIEVYLNELRNPATGKPWIVSNPIYVR